MNVYVNRSPRSGSKPEFISELQIHKVQESKFYPYEQRSFTAKWLNICFLKPDYLVLNPGSAIFQLCFSSLLCR